MAAYWDLEQCGPHGDNHNWDVCGRWLFQCPKTRTVPTSLCTSGRANLIENRSFVRIGDCTYAYYAQYACEAVDTRLAAYWDYGACGPGGNDQNWRWCGWTSACPQAVSVSEDVCVSGSAFLVDKKTFMIIDGCPYAYYAQYVCGDAPDDAAAGGSGRRLYLV